MSGELVTVARPVVRVLAAAPVASRHTSHMPATHHTSHVCHTIRHLSPPQTPSRLTTMSSAVSPQRRRVRGPLRMLTRTMTTLQALTWKVRMRVHGCCCCCWWWLAAREDIDLLDPDALVQCLAALDPQRTSCCCRRAASQGQGRERQAWLCCRRHHDAARRTGRGSRRRGWPRQARINCCCWACRAASSSPCGLWHLGPRSCRSCCGCKRSRC
jgi:hypothetical protein